MNQELQIVSSQVKGSSVGLPVPQARVPIAIRLATVGDVPFMDALQKKTDARRLLHRFGSLLQA